LIRQTVNMGNSNTTDVPTGHVATHHVAVQSYSRLHFGLMEICPGEPHCYGGLGMMVDRPVAIISGRTGIVESIDEVRIDATDYWEPRVRQVLRHRFGRSATSSLSIRKIPLKEIRVFHAPEAHVGLGSGTQFACSVTALLAAAEACVPPTTGRIPTISSDPITAPVSSLFEDVAALAGQAERGKRSYIGLQGFLRGGMVLDLGTQSSPEGTTIQRTSTVPFPSSWRVVLVCDRSYVGESGDKEVEMFHECAKQPNPFREPMLRAVSEELLPAMEAQDWSAASRAIGRYGAMAGEVFRPLQGGIYRSERIASAIASLQRLGFDGVGQSSWGPTVFAIAKDDDQAAWLCEQLQPQLDSRATTMIAGAAPGAFYECGSSSF
jgi:predicted sugar kinase